MKPIRILLLVLMTTTGGCTRWEMGRTPAPQAEDARAFSRARVTPAEGGIMVLSNVRVTADSLIGWRDLSGGRRDRVALHRSQVRIFEHRGLDPLPNALIVLVAAYVIFVWHAYNNPDACE